MAKRKRLNSTLISISRHRNGISGEPFHVILFYDDDVRLVATVFAEPGYVSVLCPDRTYHGDIEFGSNSWRSDYYEDWLRARIVEYEKSCV